MTGDKDGQDQGWHSGCDVVQGFFGIWSIIGYVILGVLIWILLSAGEPERQESQPITPLRQEVQQPKQPKPIPFND